MSSLDASRILRGLTPAAVARIDELEAFARIDSTNTYLMNLPAPEAGCFRVALADHQTAGRGRHDKEWISAPGASLCLSVGYTLQQMPQQLSAMTLALGIGVVRGLKQLGIDGVSLKWPNDVVARDAKLGGILTESQSTQGKPITVVTGFGLNVNLGDAVGKAIHSGWAQSPIDLKGLTPTLPDNNTIAASLVDAIMEATLEFEAEGFAAFSKEWRNHDWLLGKSIAVDGPANSVFGEAAGVDDDGALLLHGNGQLQRVIAGSVRPL